MRDIFKGNEENRATRRSLTKQSGEKAREEEEEEIENYESSLFRRASKEFSLTVYYRGEASLEGEQAYRKAYQCRLSFINEPSEV